MYKSIGSENSQYAHALFLLFSVRKLLHYGVINVFAEGFGLVLTGVSQDKHRELAERAGVNFYITKPYNEAELLQAIRKVTSG